MERDLDPRSDKLIGKQKELGLGKEQAKVDQDRKKTRCNVLRKAGL